MADTNTVKQIDAPMPFEAIVCQKRIALSGSSRGPFDDGLGDPNSVPFEIVNGRLLEPWSNLLTSQSNESSQ